MKKLISTLLFVFMEIYSFGQTTVQMTKSGGGVYEIPCKVNGLNLKFIYDTGSNDVSISLTEALFMLKNGYLKEENIEETQSYRIANGDIEEGTKILIDSIAIGTAIIYNVKASVAHSTKAPLLLGQSVLERFSTVSFDYSNLTLTLGYLKDNGARKKIEISNYVTSPPSPSVVKSDYKYCDECTIKIKITSEMTRTISKCNQLYAASKFSECIAEYDHLIAKYPDYCVAYYNRAIAKIANNNKVEAKADFEKALALGMKASEEMLKKYF